MRGSMEMQTNHIGGETVENTDIRNGHSASSASSPPRTKDFLLLVNKEFNAETA